MAKERQNDLDSFDIQSMASVLHRRNVNPDAYVLYNDVLADKIISEATVAGIIDQVEMELRRQIETGQKP